MSHEQPDLRGFRAAVLFAIDHGKGKYTWYQLDRAVTADFPFSNLHLMPVLRELEAEGFIESIANEGVPGQPFYRIRTGARRVK